MTGLKSLILLGLLDLSIASILPSGFISAPAIAQQNTQTKAAQSGSVLVKTKSAKFSHGKPGAPFPDYKEANLRYPIVSGLPNQAVLNKVQTAIGLKAVLGQSLEEMRTEYQENDWLTDIHYIVNYNQHNILALTYKRSGVAAYPNEFESRVAVDLRTGKVLRAKDLFETEALSAIAKILDQRMQRAIQKKPEGFNTPGYEIGKYHFQVKNLEDFTIGDKGVTFYYDFDFPHVMKALEPTNAYLLSYGELSRYIRQDGPLNFRTQQK